MMNFIGTASVLLMGSMVAGFGFTLGALIALKMAKKDITK